MTKLYIDFKKQSWQTTPSLNFQQVEVDEKMYNRLTKGRSIDWKKSSEKKLVLKDKKSQDALVCKNYAKTLILKTDWMVTRHLEQSAAGIKTSLSDEQFKKLAELRQKLRDEFDSAKPDRILKLQVKVEKFITKHE